MGRPLDDDERDRIADALRAGRSVRDVAAEFKRSTSTVSGVASGKGIVLDASRTAAATERRVEDHQARIVEEAEAALADAKRLRQRWSGGGVLHNWHKGEHFEHHADSLPTGDIKNLAIAWGIAVQRALELRDFGDLVGRIEELERRAEDGEVD